LNRNMRKPQWVFVIKRNGKPYRYMARVTARKYEKIYLGCFKTQTEAAIAVEKYFENPQKYETKYT